MSSGPHPRKGSKVRTRPSCRHDQDSPRDLPGRQRVCVIAFAVRSIFFSFFLFSLSFSFFLFLSLSFSFFLLLSLSFSFFLSFSFCLSCSVISLWSGYRLVECTLEARLFVQLSDFTHRPTRSDWRVLGHNV